MKRLNNDPKYMMAKYTADCSKCSKRVLRGEQMYYFPSTRRMFCEKCGEDDYNKFIESCQDEQFYNSQY